MAAGFASSSNRQIIDLALRQGALTECFRVTVSSKELDHGKLALTSAWMRRLGCCWSLTTSSSEATSMSDATSVDPTAVLFGLEEEFSVLAVERIRKQRVAAERQRAIQASVNGDHRRCA